MKPRESFPEPEFTDSQDSLAWAEGFYSHRFKLSDIDEEHDVPPLNAATSKKQAREMVKSYVIDEEVDDTMDSVSDAERRGGYGKWTVSGAFGTAKHPSEYGGSYGGLKGYT